MLIKRLIDSLHQRWYLNDLEHNFKNCHKISVYKIYIDMVQKKNIFK